MVRERLWTVAELADYLHVTEWTVRHWLKAGKLQGYRPGGTKAGWRIADAEVERFLQRSARSAGEDGEH